MTPRKPPEAQGVPVPDDALADLDDAGQVELIEPTGNELAPEDEDVPQPPQDGTYQPPAEPEAG